MSPRLHAVIEYRFVRPEDVNPETDTVVTGDGAALGEGFVDSPIWVARAKGYAETARLLRERAAELQSDAEANGRQFDPRPEEYRRAAAHMEAGAPTAERTVCVRRRVGP